ncbi:MAG: hypothetical protein A3F13_05325 [Gammaproteobacteria bacterium RIFCSPHIGHO2_12_FULL_40_19]|nr:MAG: hypothetical protein A3F13_05325 [Gammaproteobacteria bacterium RIFCSPHIGHO2_12_FULL_40_19]
MSQFDDRINQFIDNNPKQALKIAICVICFVWSSPVCLLGLAAYFVVTKMLRLQWHMTLGCGVLFSLAAVIPYLLFHVPHLTLQAYFLESFRFNKIFWKLLFTCQGACAFTFLAQYALSYILGFPVLFAGILSTIDLAKDTPHQDAINDLKNGKHPDSTKELREREIVKSIRKLKHHQSNGVLLGVSTITGKAITIPDYYINQIVLVLGTTGSGKTVTLQRFYQRAIERGYPLIVIDGKPTQDNIDWLKALADKHQRRFYGFNCENYNHYDPLSNGDCSELKDKIISLKDEWESDYYRSIAEDYLQTTLEILLRTGEPFGLKRIVTCLNFDNLKNIARSTNDAELIDRAMSLSQYDLKDITGLRAHLNTLVNSTMGKYFEADTDTFTLEQIIKDDAVVYFALPALRYPNFSKVLGKLVINDIKATIEHNTDNKRVFMVFDEFSVFAGDQVLNLVNMGRGKGVHAVFGTQGIADLNRVNVDFKSQMLNCANTLICHRLNDQESAESVASWAGTKNTFNVTAQFNSKDNSASLGSVRPDKTFIIHPESIKQRLRTGEAYYVSKVGEFTWEKVRVVRS